MNHERLPPHSLDAERAVLGCVLLRPSTLDEIRSAMPQEAFFHPANREIFEAMTDVARSGHAVDVLQLAEAMKRRGSLARLEGGISALVALANSVPTAENLQSYIGIVVSKWRLRGIANTAAEVSAGAFGENADPDELLMRWRSGAAALELTGSGGPVHVGSHMGETMQAIENKTRDPWADSIPTGITGVDLLLGGLARRRLHVIAGPPGMGKTAWLNSVADNATEARTPVLIVSQEMGHQEEAERFLSLSSGVEARKIHAGNLAMEDWQAINRGAAKLRNRPLWIEDRPIPLAQIVGVIRQWVQRVRHELNDPKLNVLAAVDYAQIVRALDGKANMTERLESVANSLKQDVAKAMDCTLVLLSQVNTKLIAREARAPRADDLYGGSMDQQADTISIIWRPSHEDPQTGEMVVPNESGPAQFICRKNKGGKTGVAKMWWYAEQMRYGNPPLSSEYGGYSMTAGDLT